MKTLLLASSFALSYSAAIAGNLAYIAPEVTAIEEPARMGGSGAWLIPLVIVAVLALALTQNSTDSCNFKKASGARPSVIDPCLK